VTESRLDAGVTLWLTGLPSSGKTTIATAVVRQVTARGYRAEHLDGDEVRTYLTADLGYSRADRDANVRRIGYVAHLLSRNGVVVVCSLVSPYRAARDELRRLHGGRFVEAWVSTPVEVCARRDVKGLYARQRAGEMAGLTGVDDPYEEPLAPDLVLPAHTQTEEESVAAVLTLLDRPAP